MLKLEPREADLLPVPDPAALDAARPALAAIRPQVAARLRRPRGLPAAARLVDDVLLIGALGMARGWTCNGTGTHVKPVRVSGCSPGRGR
jgi:adenine-specific DNA-methyltransferase